MSNNERADGVVILSPHTEADVEQIALSLPRSSYRSVTIQVPLRSRLDVSAMVRALRPTVQSFSLYNFSMESLGDPVMPVNQSVRQLTLVGCCVPAAPIKFTRLHTLAIRDCETHGHEMLQQLLMDSHSTLRTVNLVNIPRDCLPPLLATLIGPPENARLHTPVTGTTVSVA